jgi:hypothetical protein
MKTRAKRRLAIGLGALATACVCLVAPFAMEQLYLVQLDSVDEATRQKAAGALAQARSIRAVPRLADMFRRIPLEYVPHSFTEVDVLHYSGLALVAIGPSSVPVFIDVLRSENEHNRDAAIRALGHIASLAAATETDDREFARNADWAIQRIQGTSAAPDSPGWEWLQRKIEQLRMETLLRGEMSQWPHTEDPL